MAVNQPPILDDAVLSSWQYEVTSLVNELEAILQRSRATRGPDFPLAPELGAEHYLTIASGSLTVGWYKYDTSASWVNI